MGWGLAEGIALMSVGVTFVSVVYAAGSASAADRSADAAERSAIAAEKSAAEAARTNKIGMHGHQKLIYDSFTRLHMHMLMHMRNGLLAEVGNFYPYATTASMYLNADLARKIKEYADVCFALLDLQQQLHASVSNRRFTIEADLLPETARDQYEADYQTDMKRISTAQEEAVQRINSLGREIDAALTQELKLV